PAALSAMPYAFNRTIFPCRATNATTPGIPPDLTASSHIESIRATRSGDTPTRCGSAIASGGECFRDLVWVVPAEQMTKFNARQAAIILIEKWRANSFMDDSFNGSLKLGLFLV